MFAHQLAAAIDAAHTLARLDELSRSIWQAAAAEALTDEAAQQLAERIHAKRAPVRKETPRIGIPPGRATIFPRRRYQRSPDKSAAIERRRRLAASGPMPPQLAALFTTAELAVLRIVADEVRHKGQCEVTLAEIAARAGVCRTTVQRAMREAAASGLILIEERRQRGKKNLPNVVRLLSREWRDWLRKQPVKTAHPTGFQMGDPSQYRSSNQRGKVTGISQIGPDGPAGNLFERKQAARTGAS